MSIDMFFNICVFIFGTIIGSFLNVCIVRWPHERSVVSPGSHCPACKHPVRWFDNIPVLSYFLLGGKCRDCGARFSWRYAGVEFLTGCIFLGFYLYYGLSPVLFPYLVMVSGFIVATFVDFEHRIIPDEVSIGGMFVGFALSLLIPGLHSSATVQSVQATSIFALLFTVFCLVLSVLQMKITKTEFQKEDRIYFITYSIMAGTQIAAAWISGQLPQYAPMTISLAASIQGAIIGGGVIYLLGMFGEIIFRKEAMGGGDIKLMAMIGAFLGWKLAVLTFFLAPFFGAVVGIIEKIRTKDSTIAYGPYIVLGAIISMLFGNRIIHAVLTGDYSFTF